MAEEKEPELVDKYKDLISIEDIINKLKQAPSKEEFDRIIRDYFDVFQRYCKTLEKINLKQEADLKNLEKYVNDTRFVLNTIRAINPDYRNLPDRDLIYRIGEDLEKLRQDKFNFEKEIKELREKNKIDGLTGLFNKATMEYLLDELVEITVSKNQEIAVIMGDVDKFKEYNDTYGHKQGDQALKAVASMINSSKDPADIAARYGGEEFTIIIPDTTRDDAFKKAEKIRKNIENIIIPAVNAKMPDDNYKHTTISQGIIVFNPYMVEILKTYFKQANGTFSLPEALIQAADIALYNAKYAGRNTIVEYKEGMTKLNK